MTPKQTDPQFKLRMTPEIKEAIEQASALSGRSMNAEILFRLEMSFKTQPELEGMIKKVRDDVESHFETLAEMKKELADLKKGLVKQ